MRAKETKRKGRNRNEDIKNEMESAANANKMVQNLNKHPIEMGIYAMTWTHAYKLINNFTDHLKHK